MFGGSSPASLYRLIRPAAIASGAFPPPAVMTETRTWPCSLPTLVHQAAVPAAAPASFLVTYSEKIKLEKIRKKRVKICLHYVYTQNSAYKQGCDTFFVESILRTEPKTLVILAFTSCSRPKTSLAYTANSHLGLGRGGSANAGGGTAEDLVNGSQAVRYCRTRCIHASLCCSCSFLYS